MRLYYLVSGALTLACLTVLVFSISKSVGESAVVHGAGLSCFSITSPTAIAALPADQQAKSRHSWKAGSSCDAMCAAEGAACTGIGGYSGPFVCTDVPVDFAVCRCCAVSR